MNNPLDSLAVPIKPAGSPTHPAQSGQAVSPVFLDDASLIHELALKREDLLGDLYDRYGRLVYSLAMRSIENQAIAEEITQDVFVQVWKKAGSYDASIASVATWLSSITRHRIIDEFRREKAHPERNGVDLFEVSEREDLSRTKPEEETELSWRQRQVREALKTLSPGEREALSLAYFKGYSQSEIARILGIPLGTVKTRIRSSMKKLRLVLSQVMFEEE